MGHSRGGSTAMLAGALNGHVTHILAAMSHDAPSTMLPSTRKVGFQVESRDIPSGGRRRFLLPVNYFDDAEKYDIHKLITKCTKPKLFIYSANDKNVYPREVKELYGRASPPKEIYGIESEHNYRLNPKAIRDVNRIIGEFLDKYD